MYSGVRSAICLAVILTMPTAAFSDAPIDPQKLYAQAKAGDVEAMCGLSKLFYVGDIIKKDLKASFAWAEAGAKLGAARCINNLGVHYAEGIVVPKDEARALAYYKSAADKGFAVAQRNMGAVYLGGQLGQTRNPILGKEWYARAASQGDALSQEQLGFLFLNGTEGVSVDLPGAFKMFQSAANQGLPLSQMMAGAMLSHGDGTAKDATQAVSWWRKAAEQGQARAQVSLGIALINGTGVARDSHSGITWLEKAASQGEAQPKEAGDAHGALAEVFEKGVGVPIDIEKARIHWSKAVELGANGAQEALIALNNSSQKPAANPKLTPGQALGGLLVLGILGAMASGGGSADSEAECDLPSYTANWSQAAKTYECFQRNETAKYDAQLQQQQEDNNALWMEMLLNE